MAEPKRTGERKTGRSKATGGPQAASEQVEGHNRRDAVVDALMALATETPWNEIEIGDIAAKAGLTLAEFGELFSSKGAVLAAFVRRIDRIVLDGTPADLAGEPARDRLFDIMMRRIDALTPYKEAVKRITSAMKREPTSLPMLMRLIINSQRFMLAAAGIRTEGSLGLLKLQGAAMVFGKTAAAWFNDDTSDLAPTMACLDRELQRGESILHGAESVCRAFDPFRDLCRKAAEACRPAGRKADDSGHDEASSPGPATA